MHNTLRHAYAMVGKGRPAGALGRWYEKLCPAIGLWLLHLGLPLWGGLGRRGRETSEKGAEGPGDRAHGDGDQDNTAWHSRATHRNPGCHASAPPGTSASCAPRSRNNSLWGGRGAGCHTGLSSLPASQGLFSCSLLHAAPACRARPGAGPM